MSLAAEPVISPATPAPANADAAKNAQTPPADAAPDVVRTRVRAHDRAVKVKAKLDAEMETEEKAEKAEPKAATAKKEAAPVAKPEKAEAKPEPKPEVKDEADDEGAKRRSERMDRIRKAQERERTEAKERERPRQQQAKPPIDYEAMQKRIADYEARENGWKTDAMSILAEAERLGHPAESVAAALRSQLTDPSAIARQHAKAEAAAIRAEWQQAQAQIQQEREQMQQERQRIREEQESHAKTTSFLGRAKGSAAHPLTQSFHARHGDTGLINFANQFVAPLLRPDYSDEELHDHIEQFLDEVQLAHAQQAVQAAPEVGTSLPAMNGADKPSTTLNNRAVSGRVSVTEDKPLHLMPRSERVRLIKAKLGGG